MSIRYLESLMAPASMAVVGASSRAGSLGQRVWAQVRASAYQGKVWPVNPHHSVLDGVEVSPKVSRLPQAPDLALV
jgi:acetyltransferase